MHKLIIPLLLAVLIVSGATLGLKIPGEIEVPDGTPIRQEEITITTPTQLTVDVTVDFQTGQYEITAVKSSTDRIKIDAPQVRRIPPRRFNASEMILTITSCTHNGVPCLVEDV